MSIVIVDEIHCRAITTGEITRYANVEMATIKEMEHVQKLANGTRTVQMDESADELRMINISANVHQISGEFIARQI